jgi:hypothetical protein
VSTYITLVMCFGVGVNFVSVKMIQFQKMIQFLLEERTTTFVNTFIDNSFLKTRLLNYNEVYFCEIMLLEKINLQIIEKDGYNITN